MSCPRRGKRAAVHVLQLVEIAVRFPATGGVGELRIDARSIVLGEGILKVLAEIAVAVVETIRGGCAVAAATACETRDAAEDRGGLKRWSNVVAFAVNLDHQNADFESAVDFGLGHKVASDDAIFNVDRVQWRGRLWLLLGLLLLWIS